MGVVFDFKVLQASFKPGCSYISFRVGGPRWHRLGRAGFGSGSSIDFPARLNPGGRSRLQQPNEQPASTGIPAEAPEDAQIPATPDPLLCPRLLRHQPRRSESAVPGPPPVPITQPAVSQPLPPALSPLRRPHRDNPRRLCLRAHYRQDLRQRRSHRRLFPGCSPHPRRRNPDRLLH